MNLFPDDVEHMKKLLSYIIHSDFAHTQTYAEQAFASFILSGEKSIVPVLWPGLFLSDRLETLLPKVASPTLIVWGKEDRLFPAELCPYLTALTPGATSIIIENASHFPQVDQPAVLIRELQNFL